jgi:hypothetical protein
VQPTRNVSMLNYWKTCTEEGDHAEKQRSYVYRKVIQAFYSNTILLSSFRLALYLQRIRRQLLSFLWQGQRLWHNIKVFAQRCFMWLPWMMQHTSHLNTILSHTLHITSSSTLITKSQILSRHGHTPDFHFWGYVKDVRKSMFLLCYNP